MRLAESFEAFFSRPELSQIRSIDCRLTGLEDPVIEALAACPHLGQLRWLELSQNELSRASLNALAASKTLGNLQFLGFQANRCPDPTPQEVEDGHGFVHAVNHAPNQGELRARYGDLPWLKRAFHGRREGL